MHLLISLALLVFYSAQPLGIFGASISGAAGRAGARRGTGCGRYCSGSPGRVRMTTRSTAI